jgi:glyoxylase-like metal-dependent hydrolase (beta-lactamase superfamily II)/rhodanese-related sulfurtransferase
MNANSSSSQHLPGLKQFRQEGCITHLIFDPKSREAMLVDPRVDLIEDYRSFIAENRLKPVMIIDTRLHWHHLSGTHLLASMYQVPIGMSARTHSARVTTKLGHGELLRLGGFVVKVLQTPGVGEDAICLLLDNLLFTGDSLLIGTGARTDFPGSSPAHLWNSLQGVVASLPDSTVVCPGYDQEDRLFSLLKVEKSRNPDWAHSSEEAFLTAKAEEPQRGESEAKRRQEYNASSEPASTHESHFGNATAPTPSGSAGQRVASINVEKYALKVKEHDAGTCFLDVREPGEYRAGHMPGAINIPLSDLALHLETLSQFKRIYVSCQSGRRSTLAAKTLEYLRLPDVVNVSGGLTAWVNAGLKVT